MVEVTPSHPHPILPGITIVKPDVVPYTSLPVAGDADLETQLHPRYASPVGCCFRKVEVSMELLRGQTRVQDLAFYERPDTSNGAARAAIVRETMEQLANGEDLVPLVVKVDFAWLQLLDGFHRAAAAGECGWDPVPAYELLPPTDRQGQPQ